MSLMMFGANTVKLLGEIGTVSVIVFAQNRSLQANRDGNEQGAAIESAPLGEHLMRRYECHHFLLTHTGPRDAET